MDCRPTGSSVHGDSPGKNTGVGCHALLQGIFPTQGLFPGLQHCRQILYHLIHQGSPLESLVGDYTIAKVSYPKDSQTLLCELKNMDCGGNFLKFLGYSKGELSIWPASSLHLLSFWMSVCHWDLEVSVFSTKAVTSLFLYHPPWGLWHSLAVKPMLLQFKAAEPNCRLYSSHYWTKWNHPRFQTKIKPPIQGRSKFWRERKPAFV